MTVHYGIFGPVHTGIVSGIQLFVALRYQQRLEHCSTTSATGPNRCVTPGHHRTALPPSTCSGTPCHPSSRFRPVRARPPATVCGLPSFANYVTYAPSPGTSSRAAGWVSPATIPVPFSDVYD